MHPIASAHCEPCQAPLAIHEASAAASGRADASSPTGLSTGPSFVRWMPPSPAKLDSLRPNVQNRCAMAAPQAEVFPKTLCAWIGQQLEAAPDRDALHAYLMRVCPPDRGDLCVPPTLS